MEVLTVSMRIVLLWVLFLVPFPLSSFASQEHTAQTIEAVDHLRLAGIIKDLHGKPVADATLRVKVDGKTVHYGEGHGGHGLVSGANGQFLIELEVPEGTALSTPIEIDVVKASYANVIGLKVEGIHLEKEVDGTSHYDWFKEFLMYREAGPAFYVSAIVLLLVYVFIAFELLHRTLAATLGAMLMLFITYTAGTFFPEYFIISFEDAINMVDFNVIFLLMGMMIIVGVMKGTGVFQWLAYKSYQASGGSVFKLSVVLMIVTAGSSAFLDNVTTMLLLTPVTIEIAIVLRLNPISLLMPLVLASNIGGTSTLIGDPPNIMIGSYAGLTFNDFGINLAPVIIIIMFFHILMMKKVYGKEYAEAKTTDFKGLLEKLREEYKITDAKLLKYSVAILLVVIVFFIAHGVLHMEPSIAALSGAAVLLLVSGTDITHPLEKDVEWPTLVFFIMLFIIVGACEETGLIQLIADWVKNLSGGNLVTGIILVLWVSAIMSALIDNIPFTATMLPVVGYLSETTPGAEHAVLWWALALGACLGGNGTIIGASANVVTAGLSEKAGYPLKFMSFMKVGVPVTIMSLIISTLWLLLVEA